MTKVVTRRLGLSGAGAFVGFSRMQIVIALYVLLQSLAVAGIAHGDEIDRRCGKAEGSTRRKPDRVFAETSETIVATSPGGNWRECSDPAALKGAGPDGAPNTQALVWRFRDGVLFVRLFFRSGSGDWAQYADHCFRPDGSLALVRNTLNTFNAGVLDEEIESGNEGAVSRIRIKSFDRDGRLLRKTSRLLDLKTKKPVRRSFMDDEDVVFKRVADLPFYRLLVAEPSSRP